MVKATVLGALCVLWWPMLGDACHQRSHGGCERGLLEGWHPFKTSDEQAHMNPGGGAPPPRPPPAHPPRSVSAGPPDIGDPQPFARLLSNGEIEWHVFFLRSLQSGAWDHLVSRDLFHWEVFYNAIGPANSGDQRYNVSFPWAQLAAYTGSVMEDPRTGLYHAFYTAYGGGPSIGRENIVHAVSKDLLTFDLLEDNKTVVSPDGKYYLNASSRDFRDSFVFAVPPGAYKTDPTVKYMMAMAADRLISPGDHGRGGGGGGGGIDRIDVGTREGTRAPVPPSCHLPSCVTGLAGSEDLYTWKPLPPIKDANGSQAISATECPDVFQMPNDPHWYIISGGYGQPQLGCDTVRASSTGLDGIFSLAPYPCVDRYIYAAKRMSAGNRTIAVAWVPREAFGSECSYGWGGQMMTPRELWSNVSDVPGQLFSTLPPEYLRHYANFTSELHDPITDTSTTAELKLPNSYKGSDPWLPNVTCPFDNFAIVEVNATLKAGGRFNVSFLPEPLPPHYSNRTYMYWAYNLTVSEKHISFEGGCESHDWDVPATLTGRVNVKCMVSVDLLECFVQDRYAMTIRGQANTGNRTASVSLTGAAGSATIDGAAVRTEFLNNRRCEYPMAGLPVPMNGEPVPWPRGCVSHCETLCANTTGCVGFTMHNDKAPAMASCALKNCTTGFVLSGGWEFFRREANGTFISAGSLAPPGAVPGMPPRPNAGQCDIEVSNGTSTFPAEMCPLRYSCRGDCKADPTGPYSDAACSGACLAPPPPPPPPPPRAMCNTTNSTNECPGGMVCPSCPHTPCVCPPWPRVAPWKVLPACLRDCQEICNKNSSCTAVMFSRAQVDGEQCTFVNCTNMTDAHNDGRDQWIAYVKNSSAPASTGGYTEHDWTAFTCRPHKPVLTPYNCQTKIGGDPPPPPPPPPPPLVNCTPQQLSAPRHSSLWMPGVSNGTGHQWADYLRAHRSSYDTLSHTWAFWNSKYNSKCNDTYAGRELGLCGRSWSPDEQIVVDTAKELKMRLVPNLEVCCVCVLNKTNFNYTEAMGLLVADAKRMGFDGYVMDMICGGNEGRDANGKDQRANFINQFKSGLLATNPKGSEVSWFSHGFYHPEISFPNNGDFLYTMDTYAHNYGPGWVDTYSCKAGIGLEWPGYGSPEVMTTALETLTNMSACRAIGTWGAIPNGTGALNMAWFDGMAKFLAYEDEHRHS